MMDYIYQNRNNSLSFQNIHSTLLLVGELHLLKFGSVKKVIFHFWTQQCGKRNICFGLGIYHEDKGFKVNSTKKMKKM